MRRSAVRYQNVLMDSARWDDIPLRDGDIVISTPAKCGTTWTQMICALLIFQSVEFPRPLDVMSVWVDRLTRDHGELLAELAAQPHRRFLKTHTPLDGLPYDERVTYVCVGRDPRDAAISWDNHSANLDLAKLMAMRTAAVGPPAPEEIPAPPASPAVGRAAPSGSPGVAGTARDGESGAGGAGRPAWSPDPEAPPRDRFWAWAESEDVLIGLAAMLHHLDTFWRARHLPNVVLLHYQQMQADLDGTMRRLAGRLGIEVPEERWPELVRAARFDEMRSRADELTPDQEVWYDHRRFFHRGSTGQWRQLLDPDDLRRYRDRVRQLAAPDLAEWVHQGQIE